MRVTARVLWLAKGLGLGGAERLLVDAAHYLDTACFEVEVAYLLPWKDALVPELEDRGIVVHCLEQRSAADLRWIGRVDRLVASRSIDLVHTHMPYPAVGARLVLWRRGTPIVHTEHNVWDRYRLPTRWANAATYWRNRAVIAVSDAVARSIHVPALLSPRTRPGVDVEVVRHGAMLERVRCGVEARAEARALLGVPDDALVLGTVGNFTRKKDQATLLRAAAVLVDRFPELVTVLVGSGPLEEELRRLVAELDMEGRVVFTGMRNDVPALIPAFDVFALSSRFEGLPISLLEALASGIPCVVTEAGGIPEVVRDGVEGFLVAPGDAAVLATATGKLLKDGNLRAAMGTAGARRARDFDVRTAVAKTEEIYRRVLDAT